MAKQQVIVSVLADTKKFKRAMKNLGDETGMSRLASGFKSASKVITASVAVAGAGMVAVATKATASASLLEQSIGGVDAVFKQNAKEIHAWAASAASDLGLSKNQYNEFATVVGSQLKNMGVAQDQVTGQTNDLIKKGADLAAQFGGSTSDAVSALSALMRGEADPIERYGVSIKAADIKAQMLADGTSKLTGEQRKLAETQAKLTLLNKQTADAQGAFGRESNTLAGQQERLKAKFENITATLGQYFLPAATKVTTWFSDNLEPAFESATNWMNNSVLPVFERLGQWFEQVRPALEEFGGKIAAVASQGFALLVAVGSQVVAMLVDAGAWIRNNAAWLAPLALMITTMVASYHAYVKVLAIWKAAVIAAKAAQIAFNAAMAANPVGLVIAAVAALVAGLTWFFTKTKTGQKIWEKVWSSIQAGFAAFVEWIKPILADIISAWKVTWERIKKVWAVVGPPLIAVIKAQLDHMKVIFMAVFNVIKAVVSAVFNQIKTVIKTAMGVIQGVIKTVTSLIKGDWEGAWDGIKQTFSAFINGIQDIARGAISGMLNIGGSIIDGLKQGIESGFGKIKDGLNWLTDKIPDWKGPKKRDKTLLTPAGKSIMQGFLKGLQSGFGPVKTSLTGLTESLVKWQEQAIKKEADRLIEARRKANRKIDKYNKNRAKGTKAKSKLPTLSRAEAEKQAKKNVGVSSAAMKKAQKLVGAQSKTTKGIWDDGKYKGNVARWKGMNAGTTNLLSSLTKNGNWRSGTSKELRGATLADIGKAQDQVSKALSAAKETLASLKEARSQLKEQIASSIRGELDLTAAIQPAVEASVEQIQRSDGRGNVWFETKNIAATPAKATFASVAGNIKSMAAKAKKFAQKLQALVKKGIPQGLVQEVALLGTENGSAVADALLSGSASQVKELSADYASLNSWAGKAGDYVAGQMYDTGIFAAEGLIKGLEADTKKLEAAATKIADKLVKAVNKALGVASPAKEFIKTGKWSMKGWQVGLEKNYQPVEKSLSNFAHSLADTPVALSTPSYEPTRNSNTVVKAVLDPKELQAAFTGMSFTLMIDGKPIKAIARAEMTAMVSSAARGYS